MGLLFELLSGMGVIGALVGGFVVPSVRESWGSG